MLASSATVDVSEPVCAGPEDISSGISFLGAKILDHAEDAINNPASSEQSTVRRLVRSSYAYQPQRDSLAHLSVSASSRGVPLNDLRHVLDPRYMFSNVFSNLRDIGSSFFYLCMLQTFGTFFSVLLTLIAYLSFRYGSPTITGINQGASWSAAGFLIFLPALGLAAWTFARREQALRAVATVKSLTLWIYLAHRDWVLPGRLPHGHLEAVQQTLFNILGEMRSYLSPPRYYSTTFPYIGVTKMMLSIAQDRAKNVRRIASNFKKLSQYNEPLLRAGLDYAGLSKLNQYYMQLHLAFEELTNLKEYRTPLPLRALTRFYLTLVIPIFFGPYYATATISSGFNASLAIIVSASLTTAVCTACSPRHAAYVLFGTCVTASLPGVSLLGRSSSDPADICRFTSRCWLS